MIYLLAIARFCWDFVVGDDWLVAAGIVLALGLTALFAHHELAAWWVMPIAALVLLGVSLRRATRSNTDK
jgi:hypothetical protein